MSAGETLHKLRLEELHPDWQNPRFPEDAAEQFKSDADAYRYLADRFGAFRVADSIYRHEYFLSEPLIGMQAEDGDGVVVLEGNRRLAALKGLEDPELRATFGDERWRQFDQDKVRLPESIYFVEVKDREAVAAILGYRHITGIEAWEPEAQARYIVQLVDEQKKSFDEVVELIGRDLTEVRSFYRNHSIVEQASDEFEIDDVDRITSEFGVWNRAMSSQNIRAFISAPAPRDVVEREYPLPNGANEPLQELMVWVFGQPRSEAQRDEGIQNMEGRAITDSRQLNRLGKVLVDASGLSALRRGIGLEAAEKLVGDPNERFIDALTDARGALDRAAEEPPTDVTESMRELLDACSTVVEILTERYGTPADP